jgi:predicted O-methyltransferase YrrM
MRKVQSPIYNYIESQTSPEADDKVLARKLSEQIGLEAISISATEASLIQFISHLVRPSKIVEIGTLTGLSSLYFLETLKPDGHLWTFEKSSEHAALAAQSLAKYIKNQQCTIVLGDAVQMLPTIDDQGPFDVIFIDGNKAAYYEYWQWAQKNIQKGGVIFVDNAFLAGSIWGDNSLQRFNEKQISNVKKMTSEIFADSNFVSSFVPTTEGLLMARRKN